MKPVFQALGRSAKSLARPDLWGYVLMPAIILLAIAVIFWKITGKMDWIWLFQLASVKDSINEGALPQVFVHTATWTLSFSLPYLFLTLIASVCALPCVLEKVAEREYPHLPARDGKLMLPLFVALMNSLAATFIVVAIWLSGVFLFGGIVGYHQLTQNPLTYAPLLALWMSLMPMLLLAWLNRKSFVFACLLAYATETEKREIHRRHAKPLFVLG
ncbi:MAG: hypothetical protein LBQ81_04640, partial [Zoogloeaceae bacterium]|nr:hypothetical protein [Zoogloeaceae bacterium]